MISYKNKNVENNNVIKRFNKKFLISNSFIRNLHVYFLSVTISITNKVNKKKEFKRKKHSIKRTLNIQIDFYMNKFFSSIKCEGNITNN